MRSRFTGAMRTIQSGRFPVSGLGSVSAIRLTVSSQHLRLSFGFAGRAETTLVLPPRRVRRRRGAGRIRALLAVVLTVVSSPAGSESGPSRID